MNIMVSNYDKFPAVRTEDRAYTGWKEVCGCLSALSRSVKIAVECYCGVDEDEVAGALGALGKVCRMRDLYKDEDEIARTVRPFLYDDPLFGYVSNLQLSDFIDRDRAEAAAREDFRIYIGAGASLAVPGAAVVYADMSRREIVCRMRRSRVMALGTDNSGEPYSEQYKRGFFVDWRACDRHKLEVYPKVDYWLDTHKAGRPLMVSAEAFDAALDKVVEGPFRVVPFFDPAPWGGQWMREKFALGEDEPNYGWCFDCVPEENSLLLDFSGRIFEIPATDAVLFRTRSLLGEAVEARFGKDFPIRFDILDTFGGGNLSLQVHPTAQFIREHFGMAYTQDESYYVLDAEPGATAFLGLKKGISPSGMIGALEEARLGGAPFDADAYANRIPVSRHDHLLIPGGTVHCSGAGCVVLEISSTPNLFTFKLWDWNRPGLDGKPRPVNVERGSKVIDWGRDSDYVDGHLFDMFEVLGSGPGWTEERTGLHRNEFIETRRHRFSVPVEHDTDGGVNVFCLVDGREAVVSSPDGRFRPFAVHYAETVIVPAAAGRYVVSPAGGGECVTVKASIRV